MKKVFLFIFIVASIGELLAVSTGLGMIHLVCKPMIMASLIGYYLAAASFRSPIVILAMVASLAGDMLLIPENYFIAGLVAFLVSHILYIVAYRQHQGVVSSDSLLGVQRVRLSFPIILAGTGLVVILFPVLGDLKVPVMIYAAVITTMALTALFRYGRTNSKSFWLVFIGAVLFMISDSILAINKFLSPIEYNGFWIMSTYISAQYCIVTGLVKHQE